MKSKLRFLLSCVSLFCVSLLLCGCGGNASNVVSPGTVDKSLKVLTYVSLSKAKTPAAYERDRARVEAVSLALTKVTTDGLTVADVVAALTRQLGNDPETVLYVDLALSFVPVTWQSVALRNEYLAAAAKGLADGIALSRPPA